MDYTQKQIDELNDIFVRINEAISAHLHRSTPARCDCGAVKAKTTHVDWCSSRAVK